MTGGRLPDFVVVGAAKCGTTSLAAYLGAHQQIFMASPKELRFFSHNWDRGVSWYASRFEGAPEERLLGEASPQYTQAPFLPGVAARMSSVIPDARLIYLVRDPVEQMTSFFRHLVSKGRESERSFDIAVRANGLYLAVASYGFQVERLLEHFGQEQLLVMDSSRLRTERDQALGEILAFLGAEGEVPETVRSTELNTAADKLFLPRYLSGARALWRLARSVTGRLPRSWRRGVRARLSRPAPDSALELGSDSAQWIRANLVHDFDRLLEHFGSDLEDSITQWRKHLDSLVSTEPHPHDG
jgi:hypothetical protein